MTDLHLKYRPKMFKQVRGQDATVRSLQKVLKKQSSHAFIFIGPTGTGKTTLGRIIAKKVGASSGNIIETDAATNSGIDAMRAVTESMQYSGLGDSPVKVYIIDECHALSKAAWQSLLKSIEEPPEHVYWIFCTTEPGKIPSNITSRCVAYEIKPLRTNDLMDLLQEVRDAEDLETPDKVLQLIASKSEGSPRRALVGLAKCAEVTSTKEAAELLNTLEDDEKGDVAELCRALLQGVPWSKIAEIAGRLADQNPEGVRNVVFNWVSKAVLSAKSEKRVQGLLPILDAFSRPYPGSNGAGYLLLSLGEAYFG
jgi:DNA polymerase-3 subunit gamma/tau